MGLGSCIEKDIEDTSMGCASQMEDYMVSLIAPHAVSNILAMLIFCCMIWKRKEQDVFPAFKNPVVPVCTLLSLFY